MSKTLNWLMLVAMLGGLFLITLVLGRPLFFFTFCVPFLAILVLIDRKSSRGDNKNKK